MRATLGGLASSSAFGCIERGGLSRLRNYVRRTENDIRGIGRDCFKPYPCARDPGRTSERPERVRRKSGITGTCRREDRQRVPVQRSRGNSAGGIMIRYSLTETEEKRNFQLPPPSTLSSLGRRPYLECNIRRRGENSDVTRLEWPPSAGVRWRNRRAERDREEERKSGGKKRRSKLVEKEKGRER